MYYHLLTGATGLLGQYLLYDAVEQDLPLAVLARPSRFASAWQRIDDALVRWEKLLGRSLPRPVVLEGDIGHPNLGLGDEQLSWVRDHCHSVIHNAASLSFIAESDQDEPYRTNVDGTRHLIDFCRTTGIRQFHHVSTAYICGLRKDRILETETNVGQQLGNDYERSKLHAEQMVAASSDFDRVTVYRPGIIIGDSRTGFTSTYHGFYVPLKVATAIAPPEDVTETIDAAELLQFFGMKLSDRKNFVPVDWVSKSMMHIIARPQWHGRCYHLTPSRATTLSDMLAVMKEYLKPKKQASAAAEPSIEHLVSSLESQMQTYKAYWRDDPEFDRTHTLEACHSIPCPEVDQAMLRRMCEFAVKHGFGWPKPPMNLTKNRIDTYLASAKTFPGHSSPVEVVNLNVSGCGGGQWHIELNDENLVQWGEGFSTQASGEVYLNSHTLTLMANQSISTESAIRDGKVIAKGGANGAMIERLTQHLKSPISQ